VPGAGVKRRPCRAVLAQGLAAQSAKINKLGRAGKYNEAIPLAQAMPACLNDPSAPQNAYPGLWGPFVLIREGATR
jgi:hypothetical protein